MAPPFSSFIYERSQRWKQSCEGGSGQLLERPVDKVPAQGPATVLGEVVGAHLFGAQRLQSCLCQGEDRGGAERSHCW